MGTKRTHPKGYVTITVRLPTNIADAFHQRTIDPLTKKVRYGAKSQIITGLVHNSEISYKHFGHPSELYKPGDKVKIKVLNVNVDERLVGLSIKSCEQDPWADIHTQYQLGQVVEGLPSK